MRARCSGSRFECVARLENYRLCFPRHSQKRHGGVSSIEQALGMTVWGVVYQIPDSQILSLDGCEGYQEGRPAEQNAYNKVFMDVEDTAGHKRVCRVYIANVQGQHLPSQKYYMSCIIRGAEQHEPQGIPSEYVEELRRIKTLED